MWQADVFLYELTNFGFNLFQGFEHFCRMPPKLLEEPFHRVEFGTGGGLFLPMKGRVLAPMLCRVRCCAVANKQGGLVDAYPRQVLLQSLQEMPEAILVQMAEKHGEHIPCKGAQGHIEVAPIIA